MRSTLIFAALIVLGGCATTGSTEPTRPSELQKLQDECTARGGILQPIPGAHSTDDRANYACEIRGVSKPL